MSLSRSLRRQEEPPPPYSEEDPLQSGGLESRAVGADEPLVESLPPSLVLSPPLIDIPASESVQLGSDAVRPTLLGGYPSGEYFTEPVFCVAHSQWATDAKLFKHIVTEDLYIQTSFLARFLSQIQSMFFWPLKRQKEVKFHYGPSHSYYQLLVPVNFRHQLFAYTPRN